MKKLAVLVVATVAGLMAGVVPVSAAQSHASAKPGSPFAFICLKKAGGYVYRGYGGSAPAFRREVNRLP